jgi:hypothetical protein
MHERGGNIGAADVVGGAGAAKRAKTSPMCPLVHRLGQRETVPKRGHDA